MFNQGYENVFIIDMNFLNYISISFFSEHGDKALCYILNAEFADQVKRAIHDGSGKWVRYDNEGKMLKGWVTIEGDLADIYPDQAGNTYYYDRKTGLMAKGATVIDGIEYYFDEITGVLR